MAKRERLKSGSIEKKHSAWYWRHYVNGKQVWERIADYCDKYRSEGDVIRLINARTPAPASDAPDLTIADFVANEYLPWAQRNTRASTYNGYEKLWSARLKTHVGQRLLTEYRPSDCSRFLNSLAPSMTSASLQHVKALLSGIFSYAVSLGHLDVNPIRDAKCNEKPKASQPREHYTANEMNGILRALVNEPQAQAVMAVAFMGLRPAEIIGLRWEDIQNSEIRVERSMWRGHISEGGKSKRSRRTVVLGPGASALLARYQEARPSVSGYVFENTIGKALSTSGLAKLVRETVRPEMAKFGYTWKTLYAGRHGAVTEMNRTTNGNTQIVSHHFGHSPEVEAKHYLHGVPEETRKAALALDSALFERQLRDSNA